MGLIDSINNASIPGNNFLGSSGVQLYHTQNVVNTSAALFELRVIIIGASQPAAKVTKNVSTSNATAVSASAIKGKTSKSNRTTLNRFIFPISPAGIRKSVPQLNTSYLMAGNVHHAGNTGVVRRMDLFGEAPPTWVLEGTTGWQYHSNDGMKYTGAEAFRNLQSLFTNFAVFQQHFQANPTSKTTIEMHFFDYFNKDYWVVVPVADPVFAMDASRPLIGNYMVKLAGIRPVKHPPAPIVLKSSLEQRLASSVTNAANSVSSAVSTVTNIAG